MKKVVIIGVGKIAGGNKNNYKSSHAYYYNQNSNYHLVACVDKNNEVLKILIEKVYPLKNLAKKWNM